MRKIFPLIVLLTAFAAPAWASPAIDGISTWQAHSGNSDVVMTLTTTNINDIIVVGVLVDGGTVTSVVDGSGLTWTQRKTSKSVGSANPIEEWTAPSTLPLVADTITVHIASSSTFGRGAAFGVSGGAFAQPIDPGTSAGPVTLNTQATVTTYLANDLIVGLYRFGGTSTPTTGTGYTSIISPTGTFGLFESKQVTSTQAATTVGVGTGSGDIIGGLVDAFTSDTDTEMRSSRISTYDLLQNGTANALSASKENTYDVLNAGTANALSASKVVTYFVLKTVKPAGFFHSVPQ